MGELQYVPELHTVQDDVYPQATVLLVDRVSGEEEVPEGVVGLLSTDAPDVLSHVSVRARNMGVLFASCYSREPMDELRARCGQVLGFKVNAAGAVTWEESSWDEVNAA